MTVFAVMPVYNRLKCTKAMVEMLRAQLMDEQLRIIVIDDGSTDGTAEWLRQQTDLTVVTGDGSLWWGGAVHEGYKFCDREGQLGDWVLLVNDDTHIRQDFVASLLRVGRAKRDAVVGSILRDIAPPHSVLSIGPLIDLAKLEIGDLIDKRQQRVDLSSSDVISVQALSGRGTIYPLNALRRLKGMRPSLLPHYLADYDLALRARGLGMSLLVSTEAVVYTEEAWGNQRRHRSWREKYFSRRSPSYILAICAFWLCAEHPSKRVWLPFRMAWRAFKQRGA